jgi:hypothetical protein
MKPSHMEPGHVIKCVTDMTFSQKLYQSVKLTLAEQEIAEEDKLNFTPESLENIKKLLDKIFEQS